MKSKLNSFKLGVLIGFIIPPATLYFIYITLTNTLTFKEFIQKLIRSEIQTDIYIWTILPVFAIFGFFYFKKFEAALKGIVLPTMIYTFALIILNF